MQNDMLNVSEEKAKVAIMQQKISDISSEESSLKKVTDDTKNIFSGKYADDYVVELIDHVNKIQIEIDNLSNQVNSINGVIDQIHQNEIAQKRERENNEQNNNHNQNDNRNGEVQFSRPYLPYSKSN